MSTNTNIPATQNAAVGPAVDDLKAQFSERSIPLESDFADLIDIADCGRRAVGLSPEQTPNTYSGLVMDDGGQLVIQPAPAKGIVVNTDGVGVVAGNGIMVGADVAVKAAPNQGVKVDANGVAVDYDSSLAITSGKLSVAGKYVTTAGDSSIHGGNLTFANDDNGIVFNGGSKIIKKSGTNMLWYKGSSNALPQICDNNGSNASNIATEVYVNRRVVTTTINTTNSILRDILTFPDRGRPYYARIAVSCNSHQHFVLTVNGFCPYYGGTIIASLSNVRKPSNAAISRVFIGDDLGLGRGGIVKLDIVANANITITYSISELYNATVESLTGNRNFNGNNNRDVATFGEWYFAY